MPFQNNVVAGASGASSSGSGGMYSYTISNSVKLNGTNQALEKAFSSTESDSDKKALSFWIKRTGATGTNSDFFSTTNTKLVSSSAGNGSVSDMLEINTNNPTGYSDQFHYYLSSGGSNFLKDKWRDSSAWIHIIWIYNSDESTATDRIKVYINGVQKVINDSNYWDNDGNNGYPASGTDTTFGKSGNEMHIGRYVYDDAGWWGGQMADFIMIDGAASASDFGEFDSSGMVWKPKDPSGLTFGNNGVWLKFSDSSDIGNDSSGNNHDFTVVNIDAHDIVADSPTQNFCTQSLVANPREGTITESGTKASAGWVTGTYATFAIPHTGSWYWEYVTDDYVYAFMGIHSMERTYEDSSHTHQTDFAFVQAGEYRFNGSNEANTGTIGTGTVVGVHVEDGVVKVYANNSLDHTYTATFTDGLTYFPVSLGTANCYINYGSDSSFSNQKTSGSSNASDDNNFGDFFYTPKGLALCSENLALNSAVDPLQTSDDTPNKLFSAVLYTGNGSSQNVTGVGFQPDWTWIKNKDGTQGHKLFDSSRGVTKVISSHNNDTQATESGLSAFISDGFSFSGSTVAGYNTSGNNYVSWNFRANGGTTSAGSGDLTSTHQVSPDGSFSIVKAVGSGSGDRTVSHGLSSAPKVIISKNLDTAYNWDVYWPGTTSGNGIRFNTTDAQQSGRWGTVNSTIFTCKENYTWTGTDNYIYYCFANSDWIYSSYYVGTGDTSGDGQGRFLWSGGEPAMILVRRTSSNNWRLIDNARDLIDPRFRMLVPNSSAAEDAYTDGTDYTDFLANGARVGVGGNSGNWNSSGETYGYLIINKCPFKYSRS
tara:strand:+ start:404 stop:2869 length:2466 start_codon:yes stop_codon:yes gene_type:complete